MWTLLIGLINPIVGIVGKIADAKVELAKAQTDQERIHAQEMVDTLRTRRDVMVAEASGPYAWVNALMRFMLAFGPMVYLNKIYIYDKVFGWGSTDPLDSHLWNVVMAVIGFG